MKHLIFQKIGLVILIGLILSFSCGGKVTTRSNPTKYKFTINGVVVKDLSLGKDIIYFKVLKDSVSFDGAVVKVGADTIKSNGYGMYIKEASKIFNFGQSLPILISSAPDSFSLSTSVSMPTSFSITGTNHPIVTSNMADKMKLYFSQSTGATGYFMSIIQPENVDGYTRLIPATEIGDARIPPETFYNGPTFVTGTYKIYVVAYRSSFLVYPDMKFFLPDGLPANNISGANGTIGAGVVADLFSIKAE